MAKRGRPTEYDPEYHPAKAYEFCCEFGFTDLELGRVFDVDKSTITNWKKQFPEFLASLRAGKDEYDSNVIEKSLRGRATGFQYTETTKRPTKSLFGGGGDLVVTKEVRKMVVADTKAIEFWLRNRRSERWPDKQEIDLTGNLGIDISEMDEKRKAELRELAKLRSGLALQERRDKDEPTNPS